MPIATTFYEKYIPSDRYETHLEQLALIGFKSIEFLPHPKCMSLEVTKQLQTLAHQLKLETAFHSPDFLDPLRFQPAFFESQLAVKSSYEQLANWIVEGTDSVKRFPLVIHSANYAQIALDVERTQLINLHFFDWLSNLIERQHLPIDICLENTYSREEPCCLQTTEAYLDFFKQMKGAPISLCLDLPHWWRQCLLEKKAPERLFETEFDGILSKTIYSHLHGIDEKSDKSHLVLNNEHSRFLSFVKAFSDKKTQINLNLEIFDLQENVNFTTYETVLLQQFQLVNTIVGK